MKNLKKCVNELPVKKFIIRKILFNTLIVKDKTKNEIKKWLKPDPLIKYRTKNLHEYIFINKFVNIKI